MNGNWSRFNEKSRERSSEKYQSDVERHYSEAANADSLNKQYRKHMAKID
jgi:hypothetical protein